jgi:hypothetical protein
VERMALARKSWADAFKTVLRFYQLEHPLAPSHARYGSEPSYHEAASHSLDFVLGICTIAPPAPGISPLR